MSCLHALPSFLVHLCVLLCMSLKNGYPFWCYGDNTFGSPFRLGIWTGHFPVGDMDWTSLRLLLCPLPVCHRRRLRERRPCQVHPLLHLPLPKDIPEYHPSLNRPVGGGRLVDRQGYLVLVESRAVEVLRLQFGALGAWKAGVG